MSFENRFDNFYLKNCVKRLRLERYLRNEMASIKRFHRFHLKHLQIVHNEMRKTLESSLYENMIGRMSTRFDSELFQLNSSIDKNLNRFHADQSMHSTKELPSTIKESQIDIPNVVILPANCECENLNSTCTLCSSLGIRKMLVKRRLENDKRLNDRSPSRNHFLQ